MARCTRCGDCARACRERVITFVRGLPEMDFRRGGCTFCGDCERACKSDALDRGAAARPWTLRARIGEGCLSARGVVCRVCGERCEMGAVRFRLAVGGGAMPEIAGDCTGCGQCVAACPAGAIDMVAN